MSDHLPSRRQIMFETMLLGIVMNILFSSLAFVIVFGLWDHVIAVRGWGQLAFDFVIQTFAVAFMSVLFPGLGFLRKVAAIPGGRAGAGRPATRALAGRALRAGLIAAFTAGLGCAATLSIAAGNGVPWLVAFLMKAGFGGVFGALVIALTLPRTLADTRRAFGIQ